MSNYVKMAAELREATAKPKASDNFMQALEEHERKRAEDQARREKAFSDMVKQQLSLLNARQRDGMDQQNRELHLLRWFIIAAATILSLAIGLLGVLVVIAQ